MTQSGRARWLSDAHACNKGDTKGLQLWETGTRAPADKLIQKKNDMETGTSAPAHKLIHLK